MSTFIPLSLDTPFFNYSGEFKGVFSWLTPAHDTVTLLILSPPPIVPNDINDLSTLEAHFVSRLDEEWHLVESSSTFLDHCVALSLLSYKDRGQVYKGRLFVPFRRMSLDIVITCVEQGDMTGYREAILFYEGHKRGDLVFRKVDGEIQLEGDFNPADVQYDDRFPSHPLSRLRKVIKQLKECAQIDPQIKNLGQFEQLQDKG